MLFLVKISNLQLYWGRSVFLNNYLFIKQPANRGGLMNPAVKLTWG